LTSVSRRGQKQYRNTCAPKAAPGESCLKERMTQKQTQFWNMTRLSACAAVFAAATIQAQQASYPTFGAPQPQIQLPPIPVTQPITANGAVVEDVIARVNDQIITRSEYETALKAMQADAVRQGATQQQFEEEQKNLLRDMIDQQILLAKGKELGITGDAEMTRRLDELRKQNHLDSMEALAQAAASQGISFEDFKQSLRNQAIQQKVVSQEVGSHINMTHAQEEAFYKEHAKEFTVPEQVHLSEILIPTPDNATDAQVAAAKAKADEAEARLKAGSGFADLAKTVSGGPNAAAGGDLGDFQRGQLGDVLEKATFSEPEGGLTAPIRTRQGFVILRVDKHQAAGVPPLEQVESRVQEGIYMDQLQPALREYLSKARADLYVDVRPGFTDTGSAVTRKGKDTFTAYKAPQPKKKTVKHQEEETKKAAAVQAELAAARAKVAEKNAERAAAAQAATEKTPVKRNVSRFSKPPRVKKEKIRFGQAPRNSLPTSGVAATEVNNGVLAGQAPGTAMALTASTTTITSGGDATTESDDPMAIKVEAPTKKTRFTERQHEEDTKRIGEQLKKVEVKATARPVAATPEMTATEKVQAAPLGLNGDTKNQPKKKKVKGQPKERMQQQPTQPVDDTPKPAPTANPALVANPVNEKPKTPAPSADQSTLPPTYVQPSTGAGAPTSVPATTSADPNAPVTTPSPH